MQKYKQAAINIAFLMVLLTAGVSAGYVSAKNNQMDDQAVASQEAVLSTIENNDYEGWKKIVGRKNGLSNIIDENDFRLFAEARVAARAGDYEGAIEITNQLEEKIKNKMGDMFMQ